MPLTPKNRKEQWLEGLIQHETTLTPKNRPEAWMKEIIDASGGGGGTGGGVLVVGVDLDTDTLDKTWNEINNASLAVMKARPNDGVTIIYYVSQIVASGGTYTIIFSTSDGEASVVYTTNSADGYPTLVE